MTTSAEGERLERNPMAAWSLAAAEVEVTTRTIARLRSLCRVLGERGATPGSKKVKSEKLEVKS
jgi:hypothetical protein